MLERHHRYLTNLVKEDIPSTHVKFFGNQCFYHHDKETGRVFVHGGYTSPEGIGNDVPMTYLWDRELWSIALSGHAMSRGMKGKVNPPRRLRIHKEIYIGHTATTNWGNDTPMMASNVWNLDTGAGWYGKLTIMNVDTREYWQSDNVKSLYPNEKHR